MTKFEKMLETWNNEALRGAKAKLSKEMNVSEVTVSRWAKGELKPGQAAIKKMAKIFKKSEEEIREIFNAEKENQNNIIDGKIELTYIPVRGLSSASGGKFILEETETFLPFKKSGPNQFAIKIVGDCMVDPDDPRNSIYDGDYVIVDPDVEARNGDVIVARLDGEYSTVKRMYRHGEEVRLVPDNPEYAPIIRTGATFIVGKVIDVYRPVRAKKERNN
ncbi:S24 family peptidase [Candidatus Proelusimicrobium volucris]|uniref:S24 family peptidase n=1 Tax=Candidatus Proelusimicrobium volucris TaxID=3416225 RepID=UPI003D105E01